MKKVPQKEELKKTFLFTNDEINMLTNSLDSTINGISTAINQTQEEVERKNMRNFLDKFRALQKKLDV